MYAPEQKYRLDKSNGPAVVVVSHNPATGYIRVRLLTGGVEFNTTGARLHPFTLR